MGAATRAALAVALAIAVVSCGDDDDAQPATSQPSTAATATTAPRPETTAPAATIAPAITVAPAAPTSAACPTITNVDPVSDGFPMQMSSLVGADIRTGAHPCSERIVLELGGEGELPGYRVAYEDDPIRLSPSDQTVEVGGGATLVLRVAAWMTNMEGEGYQGPTEIAPTNVEHVVELRMIENFEGLCAWAIGLDEQRPFTVTTLTGPPRIVIDVATS